MNMSENQRTMQDRLTPVAQIIRDAGGEIVGRTKLQKTVYLLVLAGFERGFRFGYKHYGPFSEELADAADLAAAFGVISERQQQAAWGGTYSVYNAPSDERSPPTVRS